MKSLFDLQGEILASPQKCGHGILGKGMPKDRELYRIINITQGSYTVAPPSAWSLFRPFQASPIMMPGLVFKAQSNYFLLTPTFLTPLSFFFFSSTTLLLPTHLPPPSCTHAQSCSPMDFSPPDSSVHGLFQARILEWIAISFSTNSPFLLHNTTLY